jgi:hypothetical protein
MSESDTIPALTPTAAQEKEVGRAKKYDTVVTSGQSALRALLTMNGGAVIVFLTLLGHVWDKGKVLPPQSMNVLVAALVWWIGGIFSALLSYGAIFITNCFSSIDWRRSSNGAFGVTLASGIASLACFVVGSARAIAAFQLMTTLLKP